jgi:hypothetical protein
MIDVAAVPDTTALGIQLFRSVGALSDRILSYAVALAAVGALAMALTEAWKKVFDSKRRYHASRWTRLMLPPGADAANRIAYAELLQLCTGCSGPEAKVAVDRLEKEGAPPRRQAADESHAYAIFAQETSAMMVMIMDAVDVAMAASPSSYDALFRVMVAGANKADVNRWANRNASRQQSPTDARELAEVFGRLRQIARRRIDAFQVYTEERWAAGNQLAANAVGTMIMGTALYTLAQGRVQLATAGGIAAGVLLSLTGGLLAPVAKDLVTALKKVREP